MTENELVALLRDPAGVEKLARLIGQGNPNEARYRSTSDPGRSSRRESVWWLNCEKCPHYAPMAFTAAVIRWGPNTTGDKLRQCARCGARCHKGATLQHPGWVGGNVGLHPALTASRLCWAGKVFIRLSVNCHAASMSRGDGKPSLRQICLECQNPLFNSVPRERSKEKGRASGQQSQEYELTFELRK